MVISVGGSFGKLKQRNDKRPDQLQKLPQSVLRSPRSVEGAIVSLGRDPFTCSFSRLLRKKRQRNKLDLSWKFFVT